MENLFSDILNSDAPRKTKAKEILKLICQLRSYSWAGLYDVKDENMEMISCNGPQPAFLVFPRTKGLNGRAVSGKSVVLVNDVQNDPDYLTTFGKTQSEIVIPVISRETNEVVGTIDVESNSRGAFQTADVEFLTDCAAKISALWPR